jgi:sulfofructose kinase
MSGHARGFLAVTNGADDILWWDDGAPQRLPVFAVEAVDTLAAGDVFHGAFALALAEGRRGTDALRFAAAAAALKCTRFGGGSAAPTRAEVEALLATAARLGP